MSNSIPVKQRQRIAPSRKFIILTILIAVPLGLLAYYGPHLLFNYMLKLLLVQS